MVLEVVRVYVVASGTRDGDARTYVDCFIVDGVCGEVM